MSSFKIATPASIGNFIVGFDHIGAAVDWISDEIIFRKNNAHREVHISKITGDRKKLSKELKENTAGVGIQAFLDHWSNPLPFGIDIEIKKCIGIGTGLGSSAASAAAAVFGLNEILRRPYDKKALLQFVNQGEALASGAIHADNSAPALLGGIQLALAQDPHTAYRVQVPAGLQFVLCYPHVEVKTSDARNLLKNDVSLKQHAAQNANTAGTILALEHSNYDLLRHAMQDIIIQPQRKSLIPLFDKVKEIHSVYDALSFGISGAGPTTMALYHNGLRAENAVEKITALYADHNIGCTVKLCAIHHEGTHKC